MKAQEVIYKLKLEGRTQRSLAKELGVTHGCVNNVIHGRIRSRTVATAIAAVLRLPVSHVFPDYDKPSIKPEQVHPQR